MKAGTALARIAGGALLAGAIGAAFAADITMIEAGAANVVLDGGKAAVVRFAVTGSAASSDRCGYVVEYGDGAAGDSRIIENENGGFRRPHERTFSKPGTYTIRASGKRVKTTSACNGAASTTVTVVAGGPSRAERRAERRAAAPACPEGWLLNEKSVNRSTGAFSCTPKPAGELVCPEGLRYFERDGVIGCRPDRRN